MISPVQQSSSKNIMRPFDYDCRTKEMLKNVEGLFEPPDFAGVPADVFISSEADDVNLVKMIGKKEVCLTKSAGGNIVLQIIDKQRRFVDVFFHDINDSHYDKYCKYKDNKFFPWCNGDDIKLTSKRIINMCKNELKAVNAVYNKYLPQFISGSAYSPSMTLRC